MDAATAGMHRRRRRRKQQGSETMINEDKQPMHRLPDTIHRLLRTVTAASAVLLWIAGAAVAANATGDAPVDTAQFRADTEALLKHPHRMTGTPAGDAAVDYLRGRLEAIGPDRLIEQVFTFPQTVVEECGLSVVSPAAGRTVEYELTPMRPNGVVPPATPAEGLTGELVYVGADRAEAADVPSLQDRIVVLDYASGDTWRRVFREGAKAVIFVGGRNAPALTALSTPVSANLPRYYYAGDPDDLKGGGRATVRCRVRWSRTKGRNLVALIRGQQPVFLLDKDEVVIFAAQADSFGEAPRQSPAARGAANCAALLQLAAHLKANPPRRHVAIVFFSGEARGHAGASAFYRALGSGTGEESVLLQQRAASLSRERTYTQNMLEILKLEDPLATDSDLKGRLRDILDDRIENRVRDIDVEVQDLNLERAALQETQSESQEVKDRIQALKARGDELRKQKMRWNNLRRAIAQGTDTTEYADDLHRLVEQVRGEIVARQKELVEEEEALDSDRKVSQTFAEMWIGLHMSINFDDTSRRWSFMAGGEADVRSAEDIPGLYGRINNTIRRAYEALVEDEAAMAPKHFEPAVVSGELSPARNMIAARYITQSGDIAGRLGIYNIIATTMQARFDREGTPGDVLEALQLGVIEGQVADLLALIPAVLDRDGLSTRSAIGPRNEFFVPIFSEGNTPGVPRAMGKPKLGSLFNIPIQGAAVQIFHGQYHTPGKEIHQIPAYENYEVTISDANGCYAYGPVINGSQHNYLVQGFGVKLDEQGLVSWASNSASDRTVYNRLNMNECNRGCAVLIPIPKPKDAVDVSAYDALANNAFEKGKSYLRTLDGITHWYCEDRVKAVKLFGLKGVVAVNNGPIGLRDTATREDYSGKGFPMAPSWRPAQVGLRTASDLWRLNEARMQIQRKRGVTNASIEELHGRVEDLMIKSTAATAPQTAEALAISAAWGEEPVYTHTRSSLDDLVKAVLVLLALSVPFAFALERLLIGATTIYRQIGWFVVMFILTFVALYLSHPAFAISNTPLIIFLGFAVVVLSSLVIIIIMRKFEVELKVLQGLTSTVHAADVSRFSTVMAAMSMGISTMRRRPIRTALTALTIILLTFTILCFASFDTQLGVMRMFEGLPPQYTGVFVNDVNWSEFDDEVLHVVEGRWGDRNLVCPRYWVSPRPENELGVLASRGDGSRPLALRGLLGLRPEELERREDLAQVIAPEALRDGGVLFTRAVTERLGITPGSEVLLGGLRLRAGEPLEAVDLGALQDMHGESILPVDFMDDAEEGKKAAAEASAESALMMEGSFTYLPVDAIAIVSAETAKRLHASLHAVAVYTENRTQAVALAEDLTRIQPFPVSATREDGVYVHALGPVLAASGVKDLFFPILLGGLVVFGTMLGSVTDREREIYTFSALGLAPPHVASLFFAEALVYSVIGGLGGYLLAQSSLEVLSRLAVYGWVDVPEMNYSSTNAIITILIVMLTVLVSAIYPAIKASRSANPGILRTWRLPAPEGNAFNIAFPFTVSEYDITGVVSFLKEHFDNFQDVGLGDFMAKGTKLVRTEDGMVGLEADLALAPFDLGVGEHFVLRSQPSDIPGIDEVHIQLLRTSGQPRDWTRLNKTLLDDLRRQFLIWRSLPHETMEIYRQRTLTTLGGTEERAESTAESGADA